MSHGTKPGSRAPNSKPGRNKRKCERYRAEGRREKNKARKAAARAWTLTKRRAARRRDERISAALAEDWEEGEPLNAA